VILVVSLGILRIICGKCTGQIKIDFLCCLMMLVGNGNRFAKVEDVDKKQYDMRIKKERKTIVDGSFILRDICAALKVGKSAYGFTMGNVSLIQIVEAVSREFGGGFSMSTCIWSANEIDIIRLHRLKEEGALRSARFLIDPSAYTRKYDAVKKIYECFGEDQVRTVPTHAKFVTLESDTMSIAITSSMNFTHNPRIEQFEVVECSDTCLLMSSLVDESFRRFSKEDNFTGQAMSKYNDIKKHLKKQDGNFEFGFDFDVDFSVDLVGSAEPISFL